jgi:UDP-N-acetylmuramate dehydrogenase
MPLTSATVNSLRDEFGNRLLLDEPVARHTSARIGGSADGLLAVESADELRRAAEIAWGGGEKLVVLGGGSNVLVSDAGVRGLVVHNRADRFSIVKHSVLAESGVSTIQLARKLASHGLSGFEWAIGVPGNLGGAVYGNAGAHGGDIAGALVSVDALVPQVDAGGVRDVVWTNAELAFEYRSSIIKRERRPCVILGLLLAFTPDDPAAIQARMDEYNAYRKRTQPPGATIGSMFKNPPGDYAGRLIDAAGLKGERIGGAQISDVHANFFLNVGEAAAGDVKALADLARRRVFEQFGVALELEIELIGEWEAA